MSEPAATKHGTECNYDLASIPTIHGEEPKKSACYQCSNHLLVQPPRSSFAPVRAAPRPHAHGQLRPEADTGDRVVRRSSQFAAPPYQARGAAVTAFSVYSKTVRILVARCQTKGLTGLCDRFIAVQKQSRTDYRITPPRGAGGREQDLTYAEISEHTDLSEATLSRIVARPSARTAANDGPALRTRSALGVAEIVTNKLGRIECVGHRIADDPPIICAAPVGSAFTSASMTASG